MWRIILCYWETLAPWHWVLLFKYDDSYKDINRKSRNADINEHDNLDHVIDERSEPVPRSSIHCIHTPRENDEFVLQHVQHILDDEMIQGPVLGTVEDFALKAVLQICLEIPLPEEARDEHCQHWVRRALGRLSVEKAVHLDDHYQTYLDAVAAEAG